MMPPRDFPEDSEQYTCPRHGGYKPDCSKCDYQRWTCPVCRRTGEQVVLDWHAAWSLFDQWRMTGIPALYTNRRFGNFRATTREQQQALTAANALVSQHVHAVAYIGTMGAGKTHLGAAVLAAALRAGHSGLWVSVPEFLARLRASYRDLAYETEHQALSQLDSAQFLVLDEIGQRGKSSDWEVSVLSRIIDRRYLAQMPIVLTGNLDELSDAVGQRGADRIAEMGVTIAMIGPSYRRRAADDPELKVPDDFLPPERIEWWENERGIERRHVLTMEHERRQRRTG